MQIFIAWAGPTAKLVASTLRGWLPCVLQAAEPWMSEDIGKGTRWNNEIAQRLEASSFGIICLTPESARSPWVMFEAGALAKSFGGESNDRVTPFLIGVDTAAIPAPLTTFEATHSTRDDVFRLLRDLNGLLATPLQQEYLSRTFEMFWPELESVINEAISAAPNDDLDGADETEVPDTSMDAMLRDVLDTVRSTQRDISRVDDRLLEIEQQESARRQLERLRRQQDRSRRVPPRAEAEPDRMRRMDSTFGILTALLGAEALSALSVEARGDSLFVSGLGPDAPMEQIQEALLSAGWGYVTTSNEKPAKPGVRDRLTGRQGTATE